MRNALKLDGRGTLAAVTLTLSLAGLGCAVNQNRGSGEPVVTASPAGTSAPASVKPTPMVSGAVDPGVDAIAILKANEGYQGKNLGPAAPASGGQQMSGSSSTTSPQMVSSASAGTTSSDAVVSGSGGGLAVGTNTGAVLTAQGLTNATTSGIVPDRATGSVTTSSSNSVNTAVVAGATPVAGTTNRRTPVAASAVQPTGASANQGTRIVTGADGRQVMTNAAPARSRLRRVTDALRITRSTTTTTTTTPAATTTTNP